MVSKVTSKIVLIIFILFLVLQLLLSYFLDATFFSEIGVLQACLLFAFLFSFSLLQKLSSKSILLFIVFYQIVLVSTLLIFYFYNYNDLLGFKPNDALFYHSLGLRLKDMNFFTALSYLNSNHSMGDYGFPMILRTVYSLGGYEILNMKLFNILFHFLTSFYLFKLSKLLFSDQHIARYVLIFYGLNPISVYFNASGLKEPFFVLLITLSFYFLYRAHLKRRFKYYLYGFTALLFTSFFRSGFSVFILISFGLYLLVQVKGKYAGIVRSFLFLIGVGFLIVVIFFTGSELAQKINYDFSTISESRFGKQPGFIDYIIFTISGFIGPFPSFNYEIGNDNRLLQTVGNFVKFFFSFFFLVGLYQMKKNKIKELYPAFVFILMNILILTVLAASLDHRFLYPMMPLYFLILGAGFHYWKSNGGRAFYFSSYVLFMAALTLAYNFK